MHRNAKQILDTLRTIFPDARSELNFRNPYELVTSVLLSAQCTDKKVNEVTPALYKKYPNFQSLAEARLASVEKIIRPINYYQTKSKHLIAAAKLVRDKFGGKLPLTHDELIELPGVGRKTANVVLSELGVAHTIAVDTHVFRVARRLGLATGNDTKKVEKELEAQFPSEDWRMLHHGLILHGRRTCKAQSPLCDQCRLLGLCENPVRAR